MNRVPLLFRILMFFMGVSVIGLTIWDYIVPVGVPVLSQSPLLVAGMIAFTLVIAFWPSRRRESGMWMKTHFLSTGAFLLGFAWLMVRHDGFISIPGMILLVSVLYIALVVMTPSRTLTPAR